jgi:hypothetical protein
MTEAVESAEPVGEPPAVVAMTLLRARWRCAWREMRSRNAQSCQTRHLGTSPADIEGLAVFTSVAQSCFLADASDAAAKTLSIANGIVSMENTSHALKSRSFLLVFSSKLPPAYMVSGSIRTERSG